MVFLPGGRGHVSRHGALCVRKVLDVPHDPPETPDETALGLSLLHPQSRLLLLSWKLLILQWLPWRQWLHFQRKSLQRL